MGESTLPNGTAATNGTSTAPTNGGTMTGGMDGNTTTATAPTKAAGKLAMLTKRNGSKPSKSKPPIGGQPNQAERNQTKPPGGGRMHTIRKRVSLLTRSHRASSGGACELLMK